MIDLNADLGEDDSPAGIARDIEIMDIVSSCNIACGGHAGSPTTMRTMLATAKSKAIAPGAHPSYPDRAGFGRQSMEISLTDLRISLNKQLACIAALASEGGIALTHIKPHGALYNDAQDDPELSALLIDMATETGLALVGMPGSLVQQKATQIGIGYVAEAFIDRRYSNNGRLVPRSEEGAIIADEGERVSQGLALAKGTAFAAHDGSKLTVKAQSLCLHSDSDGALESAKQMRLALEKAKIMIGPVG
ncbi:5-oxoprolinase subunit PxpA [Parasphingorhabdus sp.]|uniref:5-oxoprolinase subunit PxpA n=1 Tax=Parasphingorhabdus sp. TaxID=2709688 RepID=UPI003265110D